ncbi:hypothetical protein PW035_60920, partial [Nonomuraea angiospora]|nr:hypothetical protein [Nonomuraea angiospora]
MTEISTEPGEPQPTPAQDHPHAAVPVTGPVIEPAAGPVTGLPAPQGGPAEGPGQFPAPSGPRTGEAAE